MSAKQPESSRDFNPAKAAPITTLLIVLLIIEMVGISWYTYLDVQDMTEPKNLIAEAERAIERNYPEIRESISSGVRENAPTIAEAASKELIDSSPAIREWFERLAAQQLEYGLGEVAEFSAAQFREFLQANRMQIQQALEELDKAPEKTRQLILGLEDQIDEQLGVDLQRQTQAALGLHRQFNDKLDRLSSDAPLEPKELLERRIVRLLKTLEKERLPDIVDAAGGQ